MTDKALAGVKVVSLVQGITGPLTGAILASYGAQVIRVESRTRIEWHRQAGPFIGNEVNPDRAVPYLFVNPGVYDLTLNLKKPRAMEIMKRLVQWTDVLVENFAGKAMEKMGLGYEELRKVNPGLVMLSAAIFGQTGPYAEVPGYGGTLTALTGLPHVTGYPDQLPQFPCFAITDFIAPRANVLAIVAALDHRRKTGKGQYIDAAQMESAVPLLTPLLLEYQANNRESQRLGNRSTFAAPHGVYRCKGENAWCVISVFTDEQWESFCRAVGAPEWAGSGEFSTLLNRLHHVEELDRRVEQWTSRHSAQEVMDILRRAQVPTAVVKSGADLDQDPQLRHRNYYWTVSLPDIGSFTYTGMSARMSKTPYEIKRAPMLGEHTEQVCTEFLGLSDEEFVGYLADGTLE
jgi:benzylsuccinate CoA-transferase BbsF subunit